MFRKNLKALIYTLIIGIADQGTKILVRQYLTIGEPINLLGKYVRFNYITNPGMVFGIQIGERLFYIIFNCVAMLLILIFLVRLKEDHFWPRMAMASILGGAAGNLTDRIITGEVVDFIEIGPWPIFNVADIAITSGMVILIIIVLLEKKKSRESQEERFEIG